MTLSYLSQKELCKVNIPHIFTFCCCCYWVAMSTLGDSMDCSIPGSSVTTMSWSLLKFVSIESICFSSVQFSCSIVSDSLRPHGLQHARPPCSLPTLGVCSNSCPLSQWCHPTISSSVVPFSFPSIFHSIRVFSSESVLCIKWPILEFQCQHQSFQWTLRTDLL